MTASIQPDAHLRPDEAHKRDVAYRDVALLRLISIVSTLATLILLALFPSFLTAGVVCIALYSAFELSMFENNLKELKHSLGHVHHLTSRHVLSSATQGVPLIRTICQVTQPDFSPFLI